MMCLNQLAATRLSNDVGSTPWCCDDIHDVTPCVSALARCDIDNGIYDVVERVMRPLSLRQTRRPQSDRGKARHSVFSTSAYHNRGSSSHQGDDDEDDGASRASTPSPTTYLNSLEPLNYQRYEIPSPSEQTDNLLFERQTELLNQTQDIHREVRGGFKSFGKALRGVFGKKKK
ncbi:hypothetical protein Tco_1049642 [Tanacetum coccineum]